MSSEKPMIIPESLKGFTFSFLSTSKYFVKHNHQWEKHLNYEEHDFQTKTSNIVESEAQVQNSILDPKKTVRKKLLLGQQQVTFQGELNENKILISSADYSTCEQYNSLPIKIKNEKFTTIVVGKGAFQNRTASIVYDVEDPPYIHWLCSIFRSVIENKNLISKGQFLWELIHPQVEDGMPIYNPTGNYCVRLYHEGSWKAIEITDLFPSDKRNIPLTPRSSSPQEIWPIILTVAIWKLFQSNISHGIEDLPVFEALTSWKSLNIPLNWESISDAAFAQFNRTIDLLPLPFVQLHLDSESGYYESKSTLDSLTKKAEKCDDEFNFSKSSVVQGEKQSIVKWVRVGLKSVTTSPMGVYLNGGEEEIKYILNVRDVTDNMSNEDCDEVEKLNDFSSHLDDTNSYSKDNFYQTSKLSSSGQDGPVKEYKSKKELRNIISEDSDASVDSFSSYDSSQNYLIQGFKVGEPLSKRVDSMFSQQEMSIKKEALSKTGIPKTNGKTARSLKNKFSLMFESLLKNYENPWISWEDLLLMCPKKSIYVHLPPLIMSPISGTKFQIPKTIDNTDLQELRSQIYSQVQVLVITVVRNNLRGYQDGDEVINETLAKTVEGEKPKKNMLSKNTNIKLKGKIKPSKPEKNFFGKLVFSLNSFTIFLELSQVALMPEGFRELKDVKCQEIYCSKIIGSGKETILSEFVNNQELKQQSKIFEINSKFHSSIANASENTNTFHESTIKNSKVGASSNFDVASSACLLEPISELFPELFESIENEGSVLLRTSSIGKMSEYKNQFKTIKSHDVCRWQLKPGKWVYVASVQWVGCVPELKVNSITKNKVVEQGLEKWVHRCVDENLSNFYKLSKEDGDEYKEKHVNFGLEEPQFKSNINCETYNFDDYFFKLPILKVASSQINIFDSSQTLAPKWMKLVINFSYKEEKVEKIVTKKKESKSVEQERSDELQENSPQFLYIYPSLSHKELKGCIRIYILDLKKECKREVEDNIGSFDEVYENEQRFGSETDFVINTDSLQLICDNINKIPFESFKSHETSHNRNLKQEEEKIRLNIWNYQCYVVIEQLSSEMSANLLAQSQGSPLVSIKAGIKAKGVGSCSARSNQHIEKEVLEKKEGMIQIIKLEQESHISVKEKTGINKKNVVLERILSCSSKGPVICSMRLRLLCLKNLGFSLKIVKLGTHKSVLSEDENILASKIQGLKLYEQKGYDSITILQFELNPNCVYMLKAIFEKEKNFEQEEIIGNEFFSLKEIMKIGVKNQDKSILGSVGSNIKGLKVECPHLIQKDKLEGGEWELSISSIGSLEIFKEIKPEISENFVLDYTLDFRREESLSLREAFLNEIQDFQKGITFPPQSIFEKSSYKHQVANLKQKIIFRMNLNISEFFEFLCNSRNGKGAANVLSEHEFINHPVMIEELGFSSKVLKNLYYKFLDTDQVGHTNLSKFSLMFNEPECDYETKKNQIEKGDLDNILDFYGIFSSFITRPINFNEARNNQIKKFLQKITFNPETHYLIKYKK